MASPDLQDMEFNNIPALYFIITAAILPYCCISGMTQNIFIRIEFSNDNLKLQKPVHALSKLSCALTCSASEDCQGFCADPKSSLCYLNDSSYTGSLQEENSTGLSCYEKGKTPSLLNLLVFI